MGKGNRNRELRISDGAENGVKLSKKQILLQQEKKAKTKRIITIVTSLVLVIGIVLATVAIVYNKVPKLDSTTSATSEKYEISNGVMAYFMYSQYQNFVSQNSYYLSYYGLDTTKSLKAQKYGNMTWWTYFMKQAQAQVDELVALASVAEEKGYKLDAEDEEEIEHTIEHLKEDAKSYGYPSANRYLSDLYVSGVTTKSVEAAMRLQLLAYKYLEDLIDSYEYTDDEIAKYVEDNPESFYKFDYISYSYKVESKSDATEAEKLQAVEDAKKKAEEFKSKVTDATSFKNLINEIEKKKAEDKAETATGTTAASSGTGDASSTEKDYAKDYTFEGKFYVEDSDFFEWAFDSERKAGDITFIEEKDSKDAVTGYTVYILEKTAYKDEYNTKDVRHILFTKDKYGSEIKAKEEAEKILAEYNKGEKTAEAFGKLAEQYSEDPGSNENGGLYEEVTEGYMVEEFNDWIFDEKREVGDVDIIKTSNGYHIMYFVGDNEIAWKLTAEGGLKNDQYTEELKVLEEKYPVTYDAEKLAQIK